MRGCKLIPQTRRSRRGSHWFVTAGILLTLMVTASGAGSSVKYDGVDDDNWLDFTWAEPESSAGVLAYYNVYLAVDGGGFYQYDTTSVNSYSVPGDSGHTYKIIVAGVNAWDEEGPASEESDEILCLPAVIDVTPPEPPAQLVAQDSSGAVFLSWLPVTQDSLGGVEDISHYIIYRGDEPFFVPQGTDSIAAVQGISYLDENSGYGIPEQNSYYLVAAVDQAGNESPVSNRVGEYDYVIVPQMPGYHLISLILNDQHIVKTKDMGQAIPNCTAVKEWDPLTQSYVSRAFKIGETWYGETDLQLGYPYYVFVEAGQESTWTMVGSVPDDPVFSLIASGGNGYNTITLPLSSHIAQAASLGQSIPYCTTVKKWDPANQAYVSIAFKVADTWYGESAVKPGLPYFVNVTQDGLWPGEKMAFSNSSVLRKHE